MADTAGRAIEREMFLLLLGQKLRELRERAGLSQKDAARAIKGGRGVRQQVVSRLEQGLGGAPSIIAVLDYLRSCGAGIDDLGDLLYAYTARASTATERLRQAVVANDANLPPDALEAATRYAAGLVRSRGSAAPSGRELGRLAAQAARRGRATREDAGLRVVLERELAAAGIERGSAQFLPLVTLGRMTLAALKRTRKSRYWRARAVERLDRWQAEKNLLPDAAARVRAAVEAWFAGRG
ncbi:MAG: helix-turn-helix transcriptional regulator [bacterium]